MAVKHHQPPQQWPDGVLERSLTAVGEHVDIRTEEAEEGTILVAVCGGCAKREEGAYWSLDSHLRPWVKEHAAKCRRVSR